MAMRGTEVDLLPEGGLDAERLSKGAFLQNLFRRENALFCRPGFGQLAQYDTTLAFPAAGNDAYGYQEALGSYGLLTDFGHKQIVTLLRGVMFTGNETDVGEWRDLFCLSVYDLTTDDRWEVPLHRHTSESIGLTWEMPKWRGAYESSRFNHIALWRSTQLSPVVWFQEFEGSLFFGAEGLGLNVYRPSSFFDGRRKQLDGIRENDWARGYSESPLVAPLAPADGVFVDGFEYVSVDTFPSPVDMAVFGERVIYVSGREVFYSDKLRPQSIMSRNVEFIPAKEEFVAVEVLHGVVYLFTPSEIFAIQPDLSGEVLAGGRLTQVETDIGALSSRCVLRAGGALFCADSQGVYASSGDLRFSPLSGPIAPLWESMLSNPMTNYYSDTGWSDLSQGQPRLTYSIQQRAGAHLSYDPVDGLLFFTLPEQGAAFVFQGGAWSLWNFESVSNNNIAPGVVGAQRQVYQPNVVCLGRGVFVTGGVENYSPSDVTVVGGDGANLNLNAVSGSYYLLMLGRGGGLDRSVAAAEDRRQMNGRYLKLDSAPSGRGYFYVHEPVKMPDQYELPTNTTAQDDLWLFPVSMVTHHDFGVANASLRLGYDNTEWEPIYVDDAAALQIDLVFPPERMPSRYGWGTLAQTVTHQARTWNGAAYVRGGKELHFDFSGADGVIDYPAGWTSSPTMNTPQWSECPLFFVPMKKKVPSNDVMGMGWTFVAGSQGEEGEAQEYVNVYAWQFSDAGGRYSNDEVAQPVDWVFKSSQIEFPGRQHKARGVWVRLMSHGSSAVPLFPNWIHGVLNFVLATDYRGWVSQVVDFTGDTEGVRRISNKTSIRSRLKDSAGLMKQKVFGSDAKWGDTIDDARGNVLIGDEEWNEAQVSDRGRGSTSSWMLFGHIRSRAEKLALGAAKGYYRVLGNRRRRGR